MKWETYGRTNFNESAKKEVWPSFVQLSEKRSLDLKARKKLERRYREKFSLTGEESFDLVYYEEDLSLSLKELAGKRIIDIGSGAGNFKKTLVKMGARPKDIVNFDMSELRKKRDLDVRGRAETLPFKDESFDVVLAFCSVPVIVSAGGRYDLIPKIIGEMIRVVKKEGVIKVYPVGGYRKHFDDVDNVKRARLAEEVTKNLVIIHKKSPSAMMKITKIISSEDFGDYSYSLEIKK